MAGVGPPWWHHHGQKFEYAQPEVSDGGLKIHFQTSAASFTLSTIEYPYSGYQVAPQLEYLVAQGWDKATGQLFHGTRGITRWPGVGWLAGMFGIAKQLADHPKVGQEVTHFVGNHLEHFVGHLSAYPQTSLFYAGYDYEDMELSPVRFGHQLLFLRYGQFLNIPGPGTGHDGDPNISILVTPQIQEAVKSFCLKFAELPGAVSQEQSVLDLLIATYPDK